MARITPVLAPVLCAIAALARAPAADAQERPYTPALSCAAVKAIVARERDVTLATSENAYEMVHVGNMACASDETGAPAFTPSADEPNCLAGWRCKQRNSDGGQK